MGSKKKKRKTGKEKFKEFLDAFTWGTGAMVVFSLGFFFINEPGPDFSLPEALLCSLHRKIYFYDEPTSRSIPKLKLSPMNVCNASCNSKAKPRMGFS